MQSNCIKNRTRHNVRCRDEHLLDICIYAYACGETGIPALKIIGILRGKVHHFRGNSRHFPRGWKRQVRREMPVEPIPLQAAGESAPESREITALSPGVETEGAAREGCKFSEGCRQDALEPKLERDDWSGMAGCLDFADSRQ